MCKRLTANNPFEPVPEQDWLAQIESLGQIGRWEFKREDHSLTWSDGAYTLLGFAPQAFECSLEKYQALTHPDDRSQAADYLQQVLETGAPYQLQTRLIAQDGSIRHIRSKALVEKDPQGQVQRLRGVYQDISEFIQSQGEGEKTELAGSLQRSERRYRALIENSANAIAVINADGSLSYVSPSIRNVLGYSETEALQLNLMEVVHPDDSEYLGQKLAEAFQKPGQAIEGHTGRVKHKDGSWRWLAATITNLLHDPDINGIVDNFRDVTDTKELEHLLDNASQLARVGGWKVDLLKNTQYWSTVTREIYEVPPDFIPSFAQSLNFYAEAHRGFVSEQINQAIQAKRPFEFEVPLLTGKGNERWIRAVGRPDFVGDQCVGIFGSIQDIHARKMLELELEKNIKDLAVSNHELEQFAFIASHDLQEPLRMIDSFLSLLAKRYGHQLDEKAHQYIYFATDGARRMRQVIVALLDFSRVGKSQDKLSLIDLNPLLEQTLALKRQLIEEKGAVIDVQTLPQVTAYRAPLLQVFQNLIENALKYTRADVPPRIEIRAHPSTQAWIIAVQDNGIGIDPDYHEKIFVLFQRLHKKTEYSGTGIGLAIVKKIIERLGGRVWLESELGQGSTFYFTLPHNFEGQ